MLRIRPSALALLLLCRDAASDINLGHVESRVPNRLRGVAFDNEILTAQPPPAAPLALSSSCAAIFFRHLEKTGGQSIEALLVQAGYEKVESIRFEPHAGGGSKYDLHLRATGAQDGRVGPCYGFGHGLFLVRRS